MYKDWCRFRLLPTGATGSVLVYSVIDSTGAAVDYLSADIDKAYPPLPMAPGMSWKVPYQAGVPITDQVVKALSMANPADLEVMKPKLKVGEYHPRIWRQPCIAGLSGVLHKEFTSTIQAVTNLFIQGSEVYRHIEPANVNIATYGHRIREILILACTEVEAAWKAILVANGKQASGSSFKTNDYVHLLSVLRLDEWEIQLSNYPDYPSFKPFGSWNAARPTQSLSWYTAYNAVKHDREANFSDAKLEHMIAALGACFVMLNAQFGGPRFYIHDAHYPMPFIILNEPKWPLIDQYIPPYSLPGQAFNWTPIPF